MGDVTTNLKLPYPVGTDPVQGGDDAIMNLAKELDKGMIPYRMAAGSKLFTAAAAASVAAQAVAFTAGRFTMPPLVFLWLGNNQALTAAGSLRAVPRITTAVATTGFSVAVYSMDGTANLTFTNLQVNWLAIQMLPDVAAGGGS